MLGNYLKIALRNLIRQKSYSIINIAGLAVGLACTILILLWVQDELSFDSFHTNANQVYRVVFSDETYDKVHHYSVTPPALAAALKREIPEVIHSTIYYTIDDLLIKFGEKKFKERVGFTTVSAFVLFTLPFVKGNPKTAFLAPNSMVIKEKMAAKYFGNDDPINKVLTLDNQNDFKITGIIRDLPENSYLKFDCLTQFENLEEITGRGNIESWDNYGYNTFVFLPLKIDIDKFNDKISDFVIKSRPNSTENFRPRLYLQPLTDIHLHDLNGGGAIVYVYIFSLIALFVLLIACINFMNLATARSLKRSKEVGLRKVVGANKLNLIHQYYAESILLSFISLFFSLLLVELFLPTFNFFSGKSLTLDIAGNIQNVLVLCGITLITGIISGSYPAIFLSSLKPANALKGINLNSSSLLRKILVVFQFTLSIILIVCTIVVSNQLNFIQNYNLGFDKNQILYFPMNHELMDKSISLKSELLQNPQILDVTATSSKIGIQPMWSVDLNNWEGNNGEKSLLLSMISTDYDFLETFQIEIVSGRYFSRSFSTDTAAFVLNEAAIKEMGLNNPRGNSIFEKDGIIGVVKNFNFRSLHSEIGPLALVMSPDLYRFMAVKINTHNISRNIKYIEDVTRKFAPDLPFEYQFLDEEFANLYQAEQRLGTIFRSFSILAIFISGLGLFGLASFVVVQRTKEIGVRKVLGASIPNVILLLTKEFTKWVLLGNIIAWPIAYFSMSNWLQNFAYRIDIGWWVFLIAGLLAIVIALITVSYQTIKTALTNPAEALRYE
jgi:ABC-type antimicrobial peptide transport system permease subunit